MLYRVVQIDEHYSTVQKILTKLPILEGVSRKKTNINLTPNLFNKNS